jgi:hypothetical protein
MPHIFKVADLFNYVTSSTIDNVIYDAYVPVGDPMILVSSANKPLASLHFRAQSSREVNHTTIYYRGSKSEPGYDKVDNFHGLINHSNCAFELVITNFSPESHIQFNVTSGLKKINEVNVVRSLESYTIKSDYQAGNARLILEGETKMDEDEIVQVTVRENETMSPDKRQGLSYFLSVLPEKTSIKLCEEFKNAKWVSADKMQIVFLTSSVVPKYVIPAQRSMGSRFQPQAQCSFVPSRPQSQSTFGQMSQSDWDLCIPQSGQILRRTDWDRGSSSHQSYSGPTGNPNPFGIASTTTTNRSTELVENNSARGPLRLSETSTSDFCTFGAFGASSMHFNNPSGIDAFGTTFGSTGTNTSSFGATTSANSVPNVSTFGSTGENVYTFGAASTATTSSLNNLNRPFSFGSASSSSIVHSEANNEQLILNSQLGKIKHGDKVDFKTAKCTLVFDETLTTSTCRLELSINEQLKRVAITIDNNEYMELATLHINAIRDTAKAELLKSIKPFKADECVVCLGTNPNLITLSCAHQVLHSTEECFPSNGPNKIRICPVCRSIITSTLCTSVL